MRRFGFSIQFLTGLGLFLGVTFTLARPIHIMPLGDSITLGYTVNNSAAGGYRLPLYSLLTNAGVDMDFVGTLAGNPADDLPWPDHEGHPNYRIDQIDTGFLEWVNSVPSPDIILLLIGTNDYGQDYDSTNAIHRLDALLSKITSNRPNAIVIVSDLLERKGVPDEQIQATFNPFLPGVVAQHAAKGEQVFLLDIRSVLTVDDMMFDRVHPNHGGYRKMARKWYEAIRAIYAPFNASDLAFSQPVVTSVDDPNNPAATSTEGAFPSVLITDVNGPIWVYVDLGLGVNINRVRWVWGDGYAKAYEIQISMDSTNWTSVYRTTDGAGGTNSVTFAPTVARYVRLYATERNSPWRFALDEMQVFATPLINLALNQTVTTSSTADAVNLPPTNMVDGDPATRWSALDTNTQWITVDLGAPRQVGWVRLNWAAAYGRSYQVQLGTNGSDWVTVYNATNGVGGSEDISFTAAAARYVRLRDIQPGSTNACSLAEIGIYGAANAPAGNNFAPLVFVPDVKAAFVRTNGNIRLDWPARPNGRFGVQYSTSLAAPVWFDHEPQVQATSATASQMLDSTNAASRFYRVKPAF